MDQAGPWILGVDGCRAGWLVVRSRLGAGGDHHDVSWSLAEDAAAFMDQGLLAIDMPIGLASDGPRPCDRQARRLLGPRRSSVFPAPVRAALAATSYAHACELCLAVSGKRVSKQAYNLLAKISQIDGLLQADTARIERVHEVHPELAFAQWNGGEPMVLAKKTAGGAAQRRALVESHFPGLAAEIRAGVPKTQVANDDILDALACLWSAGRIARGEALRLGGDLDSNGVPMRISA